MVEAKISGKDVSLLVASGLLHHGCGASIGIVGGTFDPIHAGHVQMGLAARDELDLAAVVFMPAGIPSFKRDRLIAPDWARLDMARIAVEGHARCVVSDREIMRSGITYTSDTLLELNGELPPDVRVLFVMGADSLETLPLWHQALQIAQLADIVVARRDGIDVDSCIRRCHEAGLPVRVHELETEVTAVSSTEIREDLLQGRDPGWRLTPGVFDYIVEHGLYGTGDRLNEQ